METFKNNGKPTHRGEAATRGNGKAKVVNFRVTRDQKRLKLNASHDYASTLRAIGQALEPLHVEAFHLEMHGNSYLVRAEAGKNLQKSTLATLWRTLRGRYALPLYPVSLKLNSIHIDRLERLGKARRRNPDGIPDPYSLSQILRAVGAYLDHKEARLLALSLRGQWVNLRYVTTQSLSYVEESRTAAFYRFSVNVHLQRTGGRVTTVQEEMAF